MLTHPNSFYESKPIKYGLLNAKKYLEKKYFHLYVWVANLQKCQKLKNMRSKILLLVLASISLRVTAQEPNKIALIVAISKYPSASNWNELNSANDVPLIKGALKDQGFKDENITILKDQQATLAGMTNAFDKLIQKAKAGDIVVFHFSGHGEQIEDDNGDEGDGLDEALVSYDALQEYKAGAPIKHFRDDLLAQKIKELRTVLGPAGNLLVIVDACHSGTSTRGLGVKRGTNKIYASPDYFKKLGNKKVTIGNNDFGVVEDGNNLAPMADFFASAPDQCNSEVVLDDKNKTGVGSLSLAFSKALQKAEKGDKNLTYRGLFDEIKVEMGTLVPGQTPMAEGTLDKVIFGGKLVTKPVYYTADADSVDANGPIQIKVGKIYGIFDGTSVKFYKPDTRPADTANVAPWATGTITYADQYFSTIKLDKQISKDQVKRAWIYLDKINYGELAVKVQLKVVDQQNKNTYQSFFKDIPQASLVNDGGDLIVESGMDNYSPDSIYIVTPQEIVIWKTSKNLKQNLMADSFQMKIADYALARYLKNLTLTNANYEVSFEIVPLKCIANCDDKAKAVWADDDAKKKESGSGNIVFKNGDRFRFNIINKTNARLYYTIIDIQPDNIVNVLLPGKGEPAENYIIKPDQEKFALAKGFTIRPPYGTDVFKIIASTSPLDLRTAFTSKGELKQTRGNPLSPFEKAINARLKKGVQTRGGEGDVELQSGTVNIINTSITIVPKN